MKYNNRLLVGRKRIKNEALELRENLKTNPNYNIFVGEKRYKMDFWLGFQMLASELKYAKSIRNRTKPIIVIACLTQILLLTFAYITSSVYLRFELIVFLTLVYSVVFMPQRRKHNFILSLLYVPNLAVSCYLVYNLIINSQHEGGIMLFLHPFILGLGYGKSWAHFLRYSLAIWTGTNFTLLVFVLDRAYFEYIFGSENLFIFLNLAVYTITYGCGERVLKEMWVIADSGK